MARPTHPHTIRPRGAIAPALALVLGLLATAAFPALAQEPITRQPAVQQLELHATLDGAHVVSATDSPGSGEAHAWLDADDRLRLELVFGGLADGVTGAGLYVGKATENGDLVAELDVAPDLVRGRLEDIEVSLSRDDAARMRAGEAYLQLETIAHPDGAIRGQLVPQPVRLGTRVEPEEEGRR